MKCNPGCGGSGRAITVRNYFEM